MNIRTTPASARRVLSPLCALFLLAPLAAQQSLPLGYAVPDDLHLFVHGRTSPTPDPAYAQLERACRRLIDSGIHDDVLDLLTLDMRPQKRTAVRAAFDRSLALLGEVDWDLLGQREIVFGYRLALPLPEYLLLFRVPSDRIGAQNDAVRRMLEGFAAMIGERASVRVVERRTGAMTVFAVDQVPVQVAAGTVGDILVMSTSTQLAAASMRMLTEGEGRGSIVQADRYRDSLGKLPDASEETTFVDLRGIFDFVGCALQIAAAGIPDQPQTQDARAVIALLGAAVDELNVFDHLMATTASDGTTVTSSLLMQLHEEAADSRLRPLFARQEPWRDWHRLVPADATGFYFDSGLDPTALFDVVVALAREHTAFGEQLAAKGARLREILAHVSGESACVAFAAQPGGCAVGDCVLFLRLETTDGVDDWLRAHLEACAQHLRSRGQAMTVESANGLHEVGLAAFPWIRPVVGVHGTDLVFATSPAALAKIERVQNGQDPDIRSSERFTRLGVGRGDAVDYLQYGQIEESLGSLANLVSAAGFFLALLPEKRDTIPAIKLGAVLTKLAPALREFDLHYDWASDWQTSGSHAFLLRSVFRYR